MKFHPKGLFALAIFGMVFYVAGNLRWGLAAVVAYTAIDALTFLAPLTLGGRSTAQPTDDRSR
jgi:hypothetical protein